MRRPLIPILLFGALAGASSLFASQDEGEQATGASATAALRQDVDKLRAELDETRALLDETVHYLHTSGKAAHEMGAALSVSEEEGFTFGINPRSREILLEGWRKHLTAVQKDLPGKPLEDDTAATGRPETGFRR